MRRFLFVAIVGSMLLLAACQGAPSPTPTETATTEPTVEPTTAPTPLPTSTPTPQPSPTPANTPTPAASPTPAPVEMWVNAANGLNLRADAKANAKLVATLKDKQHLVAIGPATAPDASGVAWQNVRTDDGQTGWVSAQFLTTTNPAGSKVAVTAAAPTTPAASTGEAWVTATVGLNLRAQASTTSTLVALLPFGTHLTLTGAPTGPDAGGITWQSVRTDDGKSGFVSTAAISTTKPTTSTPVPATVATTTPATSTTSSGTVYVIAANGLNLRAQPNTTAAVVANLNYGQRLTALAPKTAPDTGGIAWQNVRTETNQSGWVAAEYLSATSPLTTTTPVTSTGVNVTSMANDILQRLNMLRAQNNLQPIALNSALTAAALRHSQDMAKTGNVSYTGSDGTTPEQRMRAAGYTGGTGEEAVYGGRAAVNDAWYYWTTDRAHANMLLRPEYTVVGIGVVNIGDRYYYTLDFGKP